MHGQTSNVNRLAAAVGACSTAVDDVLRGAGAKLQVAVQQSPDLCLDGPTSWRAITREAAITMTGSVCSRLVLHAPRYTVATMQRSPTGFIPNSQLTSETRPEEGMAVRAMFTDVDESKRRLVLSQRMVQVSNKLASMEVGQIVKVRPPTLRDHALQTLTLRVCARARCSQSSAGTRSFRNLPRKLAPTSRTPRLEPHSPRARCAGQGLVDQAVRRLCGRGPGRRRQGRGHDPQNGALLGRSRQLRVRRDHGCDRRANVNELPFLVCSTAHGVRVCASARCVQSTLMQA